MPPTKVKRLSELAPEVRERYGHQVHPAQFGDHLQLVLFVKPTFHKEGDMTVAKGVRILAEGKTWPEVFEAADAYIKRENVDLSGAHIEL